jgi:hypothetical protein
MPRLIGCKVWYLVSTFFWPETASDIPHRATYLQYLKSILERCFRGNVERLLLPIPAAQGVEIL